MIDLIFNLKIIFSILSVHFISDFILQTQDQAANKSISNKYLFKHVFNYTLFTTISWIFLFHCVIAIPFTESIPSGKINIVLVFFITFISHFITDYITSRWSKVLWEKKSIHDFFVVIGFDQLLHYAQLFIMYYFLIK
jgi:uncharacterized membrane protein